MTSPHTFDFMIENPHCSFCKYSSIKFFHTECAKRPGCKKLKAKECAYYSPEDVKEKKAD